MLWLRTTKLFFGKLFKKKLTKGLLTLKTPITTAAVDIFAKSFPIFENFMSCQQPILMEYHALFVIFEKVSKFLNCRLLQIIGGALRVKLSLNVHVDKFHPKKPII